ncbi:MAG: hypothetical protein H6555_07715 [Lewinellaceae bacterium]|nr:hypothetical protein [Lewinellaceae bacterium]
MALNLIRLGWLLDKPGWVEITPHTISQFIKTITEYPVIFARWVQIHQKLVGSGNVSVVVRRDLPIAVVSGAGPEYSFLVNRQEWRLNFSFTPVTTIAANCWLAVYG